jgi:hypothetical protein
MIMVLFAMIPSIAHAGIASVIGDTFGPNGPGRPVMWLLGLSIGRFILNEIQTLVGGSVKGINMIIKCAEIGIVIAAVYALLNTAFNLLGL